MIKKDITGSLRILCQELRKPVYNVGSGRHYEPGFAAGVCPAPDQMSDQHKQEERY